MDCQSLNNFLCKIAKWRWPSFTIPECWRPSQVYTNKSYNFKTKWLQILFSLQHLGYNHNVLKTQRRWQNSVTTLWHLSQHTANTNRVKTPNNPNNFLWNTIKLIYTNPLSKKNKWLGKISHLPLFEVRALPGTQLPVRVHRLIDIGWGSAVWFPAFHHVSKEQRDFQLCQACNSTVSEKIYLTEVYVHTLQLQLGPNFVMHRYALGSSFCAKSLISLDLP